MEEDWDNLIILDACRFDIFEEHCTLEGQLTRVISHGSTSSEFIDKNFNHGTFHDTVYISANPHTDRTLDESVFHAVIRSYNKDTFTDRELDELHPERIRQIATEQYSNYNDKRIIVHFMQPHAPYLGPHAENIRKRLSEEGIEFVRQAGERPDSVYKHLMEAARQDDVVDSESLQTCYVENVNIVLREVEKLLQTFDGKTVVTADHGEMLGEPEQAPSNGDVFSHPGQMYVPELRYVPWFVIESETRRRIRPEEPVQPEAVTKESVDRQLRALGYKP